MTEEEREECLRQVQRLLAYQSRGTQLSPVETYFLKSIDHITVINKRNFNLANEYQRLENGVGNLLKKAKKEAWSEGYQRGLDVHYDDNDPEIARLGNPYDNTKVDGE